MTPAEAQQVLQLYRPGTSDASAPQVAEALELALRDPELAKWLSEHSQAQTAIRQKFRSIQPPAGLREAILAKAKIVHPSPWWRDPGWLRAAAAIVVFIGLCAWAVTRFSANTRDSFADYESRMVRSAIREYRMDILTNNLDSVRELIASRGAPSDFSIPKKLSQLQLTGGGVLRWRNNPVAMVCYDRGDRQMLFLFVMPRDAVKDPPGNNPEMGKVSRLITARWTEGDKTYLLAGPEEAGSLDKYL